MSLLQWIGILTFLSHSEFCLPVGPLDSVCHLDSLHVMFSFHSDMNKTDIEYWNQSCWIQLKLTSQKFKNCKSTPRLLYIKPCYMFYTTCVCHTTSSVIRQNCTTNRKSYRPISAAYFLCNFSQQYPETLETLTNTELHSSVFVRQASVNSQTMDQRHSKHVVI